MVDYNPNTWVPRWLGMTEFLAGWSKDDHKSVGAVIVSPAQASIAIGWNGLPRGANDAVAERYERPLKDKWMVHAERNAICNAARCGVSTEGARLYVQYHPCSICAQEIIQCGIAEVFTTAPDFSHPRRADDWREAVQMLHECGVEVTYVA